MTATEHKEAGCGGQGGLVGNRRWSNKWSSLHSHCLAPISMEVSGLYSVTGHSERQKGIKLELRQLTRGTAMRDADQTQYSASAWVRQTTRLYSTIALASYSNTTDIKIIHPQMRNHWLISIQVRWLFLSVKLRNIYKLGILINATINYDWIWHAKCDEQTIYLPLKWEYST